MCACVTDRRVKIPAVPIVYVNRHPWPASIKVRFRFSETSLAALSLVGRALQLSHYLQHRRQANRDVRF